MSARGDFDGARHDVEPPGEPEGEPEAKPKRKPRPPLTVVVGLPALHLVAGRADRYEAPTQVVVVEPITVREDLASAMSGIPVETLRAMRKTRTGLPYRKEGGIVLYLVKDMREHLESLPSSQSA